MVTRREWGWALAVSALVMATTAVPYLVAFATAGEGWRFSGTLIGVEDGNSYIAKMAQGARGAWLFTLPYTVEAHRPVVFFPLYLLAGRVVGPAQTALVMAFHTMRLVGGWAMLLVSYRFLAEFLPWIGQRRLGLVLVALGGGLGWMIVLVLPQPLLGSLPIDFISPEAFSFLTLFGLPHLALSRSLFLLGLLAYLRGRGVWAGLAWVGLGLLQPLYVAVGWLIIAADVVLAWLSEHLRPAVENAATVSQMAARRVPAGGLRVMDAAPGRESGRVGLFGLGPPMRLALPSAVVMGRLKTAAIAGALSAPMLIYTISAFSSNPVLAQWNQQNQLPSPHLLHYLLGYAVWLVPAVPGWRWLWTRNRRLAQFAASWLLLAPLLLYLPIPTQRRLIEGVHLPLVALAVLGLGAMAAKWRRWGTAALLVLALPTSGLLWLGALAAARQPAEPIFLPAAQVAVFEHLASVAQPGDAALAAFATGNALPAYAPVTAYIGHGPETAWLADKQPRVGRFYSAGTIDAERRALLDEAGIDWVLLGPHERALGAFDPSASDYLRLVFAEGEYALYEVTETAE